MQITTSTVALNVRDVTASAAFFARHLGYRQQMAAEGFVSMTHDDAGMDLVLLQQDTGAPPEDQRHQPACGVILAFTVADLDAELARLEDEGVAITLPLREEEWGERLFQVEDPSGVVVELVEWRTGTGPEAWTDPAS
jgi:catechol 2,3-dioxygenase-like lactoylglutathione lyase family enzyme